jgi:ATP-dependent RNA helicase RhlE
MSKPLPLDPVLLRTAVVLGDVAMTPIQAKAFATMLDDRKLMLATQSGTGKLSAFTLPLLQKLRRHENAGLSPGRGKGCCPGPWAAFVPV